MKTSDILSIIAISISTITFLLNNVLDRYYYGPNCKIAAYSIANGAGIQIRLENIGNRIMRISKVEYSLNGGPYSSDTVTLFSGIPIVSKSVARPYREVIIPKDPQKLITVLFSNQDDLLKGWDIVNGLTVRVEYLGPIKRFFPTYRKLENDSKAFYDAISINTKTYRELKVFQKESKIAE